MNLERIVPVTHLRPPIGLALVRDTEILGAEPYFHDLIAGIEEVTLPQGHPVLLRVMASAADEGQLYRAWTDAAAVAGVLLVDIQEDDPRPALCVELGLPAVVVGPPVAEDLMTVWTDDDAAMRLAARHLIERGHEEILHVGGPTHMRHSRSRRSTFEITCAENSVVARIATGDYSRASGAEATAAALAEHPGITAALYDSDLMALGGLDAAANARRAVPDALAIIAWDDSIQAQLSTPPLSAIARDTRAVGRLIGHAVLDVIAGEPANVRHAADAALRIRRSSSRDQLVT
jgi:DNA-binding LacI/PurR family transcriptional regulator